jgi:hypothetical protein
MRYHGACNRLWVGSFSVHPGFSRPSQRHLPKEEMIAMDETG